MPTMMAAGVDAGAMAKMLMGSITAFTMPQNKTNIIKNIQQGTSGKRPTEQIDLNCFSLPGSVSGKVWYSARSSLQVLR